MCIKANIKLSVLRSVKFFKRFDLLYKLTVRSVFDNGLIIFYNSLKQTEVAKLNRLQYRAAKLCCNAFHLSSQSKLLGLESLSARADFLGLYNIY